MNTPADFVFTRSYRGRVQAVILDWSGTTADAYVIAPAVVFVEVFKNQGVEISMLEARGPMGLRKDLHIKMLTEDPVIRARSPSSCPLKLPVYPSTPHYFPVLLK